MIKVAILGPESTGKSALAKSLSDYFNSPWIPEYAREYVEELTVPYTYNDVCCIALKQIEQQGIYKDASEQHEKYVFFDTDLIITSVWFEYRFGEVPDFVRENIENGFFDLYLLCAPDLVWEADPVREHGHDREFFFSWYQKEVEMTGKPLYVITGYGESRVQCALDALSLYDQV